MDKRRGLMSVITALVLSVAFALTGPAVAADLPWQTDLHTRYLALGDSLTAGQGAIPITNGYAYLLYRQGVFDIVPNTFFVNGAVPGMTSFEVLHYQLPQAVVFNPNVVTLTVGGNDLIKILGGADPNTVVTEFNLNLADILIGLCSDAVLESRSLEVYVGNVYSPPIESPIPGMTTEEVIMMFNYHLAGTVTAVDGAFAGLCSIEVADLFSEFQGRTGLLLIERNGAKPDEIHPTNAGHRAIRDAFLEAIDR